MESKKDKTGNQTLSIEEYMEKYSKPQNIKELKWVFVLLAAVIGLIIFGLLFTLVERLFNLNEIAGYIGLALSVLFIICLYIIPVVKISKTRHFITNINEKNASFAKRHNRIVCREIADHMIDFSIVTENNSWYSKDKLAAVAIARAKNDDKNLRNALIEIYKTDVKKSANSLIRDICFW